MVLVGLIQWLRNTKKKRDEARRTRNLNIVQILTGKYLCMKIEVTGEIDYDIDDVLEVVQIIIWLIQNIRQRARAR